MVESKRILPLPRPPHPDTLSDPAHTILDRSGTRLLCWCPRHRCGAIYFTEIGIWQLQVPVAFEEWVGALELNQILPIDNAEDMSRWVEACTQPPPGVPTAPGGRC